MFIRIVNLLSPIVVSEIPNMNDEHNLSRREVEHITTEREVRVNEM